MYKLVLLLSKLLNLQFHYPVKVKYFKGWTNLFITPPYKFKVADALLTNFHLPQSKMLMQVAAFGGYEFVMKAYKEAVKEKYNFFTYGDAC